MLASGAVVGTLLVVRILRGLDEKVFRRVVGALLLVLGAYTLARAFS
jgi:uncharacterized membrane protein YfcA